MEVITILFPFFYLFISLFAFWRPSDFFFKILYIFFATQVTDARLQLENLGSELSNIQQLVWNMVRHINQIKNNLKSFIVLDCLICRSCWLYFWYLQDGKMNALVAKQVALHFNIWICCVACSLIYLCSSYGNGNFRLLYASIVNNFQLYNIIVRLLFGRSSSFYKPLPKFFGERKKPDKRLTI